MPDDLRGCIMLHSHMQTPFSTDHHEKDWKRAMDGHGHPSQRPKIQQQQLHIAAHSCTPRDINAPPIDTCLRFFTAGGRKSRISWIPSRNPAALEGDVFQHLQYWFMISIYIIQLTSFDWWMKPSSSFQKASLPCLTQNLHGRQTILFTHFRTLVHVSYLQCLSFCQSWLPNMKSSSFEFFLALAI